MIAVDFISEFSTNHIPEPNTSLDELLQQIETHNITLALTASRRGLIYLFNGEAVAETLQVTSQHPRLLPVGILNPRQYVNWREDLQMAVQGGAVAIRFAPGTQSWSADSLLFAKMVEGVAQTSLPIIVDFNGLGGEAPSWIHKVAATADRYHVPVVMNEVSYSYMGELLAVMHDYPGTYAAIRWLCLADSLETFKSEGLIDRLLFGSNAPRYSARSPLYQVLMAKISDEDKQAILAGNAISLLKLDPAHLPAAPRQINPVPDIPKKPIIDTHAHVTGFSLPQPNDTFDRTTVSEMAERFNVEITVVSSYHAINYDLVVGNAATAALLDRHPNLRGYVVGDARDIPTSVAQMENYFQDPRFVGVKLYCPFGGPMALPRMQDLLDEVAKFGRPTLIHMDNSPYPGLRQACLRNPNLVIIKAHGDDADGARQIQDLPNVYFEFCSSGIKPGPIRRVIDILGPERVLFGTDAQLFSPWFEYAAYQDAIKTEREAELIFRANPRRIFNLGID
ncbi:MAG: hypothetical protein EXR62_08895 [Chloroflexi bacterium]|nr:hypothetical protein [Chloroflexota bacterium]